MAEEVKQEAPKAGKTALGLEPNVAALLAYLFGWVGGLVFFLTEKENKFVRFAAMQSILLSVGAMVLYWVLGVVIAALAFATYGLGALLGLLMPLLGVGFLVVWIMLMVKAYNGEEWELPVVGKIARNAVNK